MGRESPRGGRQEEGEALKLAAPVNVSLCHYDEEYDFVKVLDFGIVKVTHDAPAADRGLTGDNERWERVRSQCRP